MSLQRFLRSLHKLAISLDGSSDTSRISRTVYRRPYRKEDLPRGGSFFNLPETKERLNEIKV
jgi:hypothetical protein